MERPNLATALAQFELPDLWSDKYITTIKCSKKRLCWTRSIAAFANCWLILSSSWMVPPVLFHVSWCQICLEALYDAWA